MLKSPRLQEFRKLSVSKMIRYENDDETKPSYPVYLYTQRNGENVRIIYIEDKEKKYEI